MDSYLDLAAVALTSYNVELLVSLWYNATLSKETRTVVQTFIRKSLPDVARHYDLYYGKYTSFQELVEEYDLLMYSQLYQGDIGGALYFFAVRGDMRNLRIAISKGANDWSDGLRGAAERGDWDLVNFFATKAEHYYFEWEDGLKGAAFGGHQEFVDFFVEKIEEKYDGKGENDTNRSLNAWNLGMSSAALGNRPELVQFFIEKGANDWQQGLDSAAQGGHQDLVDFFMAKIPHITTIDLNWVMYSAAQGGQKRMVDFFIQKGANDRNIGLQGAARGGQRDLVDFFIAKGARDWKRALPEAIRWKHWDLVNFFRQKIAQ